MLQVSTLRLQGGRTSGLLPFLKAVILRGEVMWPMRELGDMAPFAYNEKLTRTAFRFGINRAVRAATGRVADLTFCRQAASATSLAG
jgi:hypothetical protein